MILTNENGVKFYLNIELIETITPRKYHGGCEITLVSGRSIVCIDDFEQVVTDFEMKKALSK